MERQRPVIIIPSDLERKYNSRRRWSRRLMNTGLVGEFTGIGSALGMLGADNIHVISFTQTDVNMGLMLFYASLIPYLAGMVLERRSRNLVIDATPNDIHIENQGGNRIITGVAYKEVANEPIVRE